MSFLCRAFVTLPTHLCERERPLQERTVFFETPALASHQRYQHLARLLSLAWNVSTESLLEDGVIYNLASGHELCTEQAVGGAATGDLQLLETGAGGSDGVVPAGSEHGECHIHYARAADVDLFVSPRTASRLHKALAMVEALYADTGASMVPR